MFIILYKLWIRPELRNRIQNVLHKGRVLIIQIAQKPQRDISFGRTWCMRACITRIVGHVQTGTMCVYLPFTKAIGAIIIRRNKNDLITFSCTSKQEIIIFKQNVYSYVFIYMNPPKLLYIILCSNLTWHSVNY